VPKWPQNSQKNYEKPVFWLLSTISFKRRGPMICLGAYFQAQTLGHTSSPLAGLWVSFWIHLGGTQNGQKQHSKPVFWLFWTMDLMIWLGAYFYA
jgi:hypothetical protein